MSRRVHLPMRLVLVAAALAAARAAAQVPADSGQVWKTYDIAPFVAVAGSGSERHVVDWILQETGYAAWHGASPASLSAGPEKLACFHVPEMQSRVEEIVTRFVGEASSPHRFTVRVFGVASPAWRGDARPVLQPIPAATPGVQAWILARENAAEVMARLRARSDCQELPTGPVLAANGLPAVLTGGRKLPYVQDVGPPGWQPSSGACDEGLAIDVHPLLVADGTAVEAVFRCRIDQVERLAPVTRRRARQAADGGAPGGGRAGRRAVSLALQPDARDRDRVGAVAGARAEYRARAGARCEASRRRRRDRTATPGRPVRHRGTSREDD